MVAMRLQTEVNGQDGKHLELYRPLQIKTIPPTLLTTKTVFPFSTSHMQGLHTMKINVLLHGDPQISAM